ncbi:MAG: hypothetical protein Q4G35_02335 [Propionibacteriaceae bacterium]|nr:hypothetical protein [Propionibacteriaceae bacterium]
MTAIMAGAAASAVPRTSRADSRTPTNLRTTWRADIVEAAGGDPRNMLITPLNTATGTQLEMLETGPNNYFVVDPASHSVLEYSLESPLPYASRNAALYYFGPGQVFIRDGLKFVHGLSGKVASAEVIAAGNQSVRATVEELNSPTARMSLVQPMSTTPHTVTSSSFITGSHVYPNTENTCGYIAGSILMRYWHARYSTRNLIPSSYRSGTNLSPTNNYSTYLRFGQGTGTWAANLYYSLTENARRQNVAVDCSTGLLSLGVWPSIRANRPVILFGNMPNLSGGSINHAVVSYGITSDGHNRVHYGWAGRSNIVLNSAFIGSHTKFHLA